MPALKSGRAWLLTVKFDSSEKVRDYATQKKLVTAGKKEDSKVVEEDEAEANLK